MQENVDQNVERSTLWNEMEVKIEVQMVCNTICSNNLDLVEWNKII